MLELELTSVLVMRTTPACRSGDDPITNIYKISDLFIVGDLVVLSLSNTQMT